MSQTGANQLQYRGINRTICIGLGGTGRDVLMRIRRLIVDRYDNLNKLPIVSFVHIDTDKAATQITGIRTGSTYHGVDLSFKEAEKVSATMSSNEVTMFVEGLERRSEYTRHGPYDHIGRWFPPQLLRNIKAVEEGAKGIRPVGRLAFFHNYQKIKTAIETAENRTRGHEAFLLKKGLRIDPGLSIFVVGSLCGGTGSGMFLDIAYSLRHLYGEQSAQIVGYLVISPELYGNTPSMSANTYAALKELNYYSTSSTKFEACYDTQNLVYVQEKRPPFDYTYLVSSKTGGEYSILSQGKLCNVIAHKIAVEFSSELAPVVKGNRDNFLQQMIKEDNHPRPNSQRYLTFGLAAIYFPRDKIVQIALTRISLDLVKFWLSGKGQSADPQTLLDQFLIQHRWHDNLEIKDGLKTKLADSVQESNKTFSKTITDWRTKLERTISECQNRDGRNDIRQQLPREFREQFRKIQPGETESTRGIWLTKIIQISPNITKDLKSNIDDYLSQLLTPTEASFSIKSTRDWLDALQHELKKYQDNLQEEITDFGGIKRSEDIDKKWRDADQIIEDIEHKPSIPLLNNKNTQIQVEAKRVVQEICKLVKHNFDLTVLQETLKTVNSLQKHIQERATQVSAFSSLVENLQRAYEKAEQELRQLNFDEMSGEAIFDNEDIESYYQTMLPTHDFRNQLVLVSSTITELTGRGQSLASFVDREPTTQDQLQKEIDLKVDSLFAIRGKDIVNSVIKRFMKKYNPGASSTRLGQIMEESKPLLSLNLRASFFDPDERNKSKLVGFKDTDESEVQDFKVLLESDLGINNNTHKYTQAEDEILIVNEYAGFPLRLISGLDRMRVPYLREQHSATAFLHNEYQVLFPDIIPPDARRMEELEDIFYPCLALGLLEKNPTNHKLEFQYYDEMQDSYYTASLNPQWIQALEELANNQSMTTTLKQILNDEINKIASEPELWQNNYLPKLRQFIEQVKNLPEDSPNEPYKKTVYLPPENTDTNAKDGIINRFWRKMDEQFKPSQNRSFSPSNNSGNQTPIRGEIVVTTSPYSTDNRARRRQELEQLKQELDDGYMTPEEYENERQKIFNQYPL